MTDLPRKHGSIIANVRQWPCKPVLPRHTYNHGDSCRDLDALADPGECWGFPRQLAQAISTDAFWDGTVPAQGVKALIQEAVASHVQKCLQAGTAPPIPELVAEIFREKKAASSTEAGMMKEPELRKKLKRRDYERVYRKG